MIMIDINVHFLYPSKKDPFEMHAILVYCCKTNVKAPDKAINQTRTGVIDARALRASKAIAGSRAPMSRVAMTPRCPGSRQTNTSD